MCYTSLYTLPEIVRYTSEDLIDPSLFVAEQRYWPLLSGVTSAMYSVNVSPTRTRSFLNQATVGFGELWGRLKWHFQPSRTLVFVGGCVKTLGCGGAVMWRSRVRERETHNIYLECTNHLLAVCSTIYQPSLSSFNYCPEWTVSNRCHSQWECNKLSANHH